MKRGPLIFSMAILAVSQVWGGSRMLTAIPPALQRTSPQYAFMAQNPLTRYPAVPLNRYTTVPLTRSTSVPGIRYAPAGQVGLNPMAGVTGFGNLPAPAVAQAPAPQSNMMADLMKAFGLSKPPTAKSVPAAQNPTYSPPVATGQPARYRSISKLAAREEPLPAHAPQCLSESSGALLAGSKACNGIYMGDGLAMTNCHCINEVSQSLSDTKFVMINGDKKKPHTCRASLACNKALDYAILSCPTLKGAVVPVRVASERPAGRQNVFIPTHDYSDEGVSKVIRTGQLANWAGSVANGSQESMLAWAPTIVGNSGSGVFNARAEATGLLWGGFVIPRKNTLFTPMKDILADIQRRKPTLFARIQTAQKGSSEGTGPEKVSDCHPPQERTVAGVNPPDAGVDSSPASSVTAQPRAQNGRN